MTPRHLITLACLTVVIAAGCQSSAVEAGDGRPQQPATSVPEATNPPETFDGSTNPLNGSWTVEGSDGQMQIVFDGLSRGPTIAIRSGTCTEYAAVVTVDEQSFQTVEELDLALEECVAAPTNEAIQALLLWLPTQGVDYQLRSNELLIQFADYQIAANNS